mgnify:CR=1 FL=1
MAGLILSLETATPICSVAIADVEGNIHHKSATGAGVHSEKTLLFIESLLKELNASISDVDIVLVNKGPGSYTGLRIGSSVAKGLLFGKKVKLFSVSTLEATAFAMLKKYPEATSVHAVLNARRTHLYHQQFVMKDENLVEKLPQEVRSLQEIESLIKSGDIIAGDATQRLSLTDKNEIQVFSTEQSISAVHMIEYFLHQQQKRVMIEEDAVSFEPIY